MEDDKEESKPAEKPSGFVKMLMGMGRAKKMRVIELTGSTEDDIKKIVDTLSDSVRKRPRGR